VVFFKDKGLKKSQQMFSDLNRHAIRPATSLARLYDHRDPLAEIIRRVVYEAEVFKGVVEMERTTLAERSIKMFSFSGIYNATKYLIADDYRKKIEQTTKNLIQFWDAVGEQFGKWKGVRIGNISASELRKDYINTHGVILQAIGLSGRDLLKTFPNNWRKKLKRLKTINWLKTNSIWNRRVLVNGRVVKNNNSIILASNIIKKSYGLELTTGEKAVESKLKKGEINADRHKKK
jgi:DNA sulfur modification protein DndB